MQDAVSGTVSAPSRLAVRASSERGPSARVGNSRQTRG